MLKVSGQVLGVSYLGFTPSQTRFEDTLGSVVIENFKWVKPDSHGNFEVTLPSTLEWKSNRPWQWLVFEYDLRGRVTKFSIGSEPGELRYVDIRPIGVTL